MKQTTCKERIKKELENELETVRLLWAAYLDGDEETEEGSIYDHGLCFDYVQPDDENGFFRWQISTGGPGDEFRFYADATLRCYYVEYAFIDWFDCATVELKGDDKALLLDIYQWFHESGSTEAELRKAEEN